MSKTKTPTYKVNKLQQEQHRNFPNSFNPRRTQTSKKRKQQKNYDQTFLKEVFFLKKKKMKWIKYHPWPADSKL